MLLTPYRVLDITDEKGLFCGRLLADLGAEVILLEPPLGHAARRCGPFWGGTPNEERSLLWWALNSNKRSITLNIESPPGRNIFLRLAEKADFIVESFPPGRLDTLGLSYAHLALLNPSLILVSISAFGQTGPYRNYKISDLVAMAMGGVTLATGDHDRPPVQFSAEQAYLMAGLHGAAAAVAALLSRSATGQGQWVDISLHECLLISGCLDIFVWDAGKVMPYRSGSTVVRGGYPIRATWPCKDGQIAFRVGMGTGGQGIKSLVDWMDSEGQAGNLKQFTWETSEIENLSPQDRLKCEEAFSSFFLRHTKTEILQEAVKRGFYAQPANTVSEIIDDHQVRDRGFWQRVQTENGHSFIFPGLPFGRGFPLAPTRPAPRLGESNCRIYKEELGFAPHDMEKLRQDMVI